MHYHPNCNVNANLFKINEIKLSLIELQITAVNTVYKYEQDLLVLTVRMVIFT